MEIYFINVILVYVMTTLAKIFVKRRKSLSNIFLIIAILIPTIIAGIRYNVGTDYFNYIEWFNQYINHHIYWGAKDIGFVILIKIIQVFSSNYQWLFAISALLINTLILYFVKKNTDEYNLGYTLFFTLYSYCSSLNITRQWIAIAIVLVALNFAFKNKRAKACLLIMMASMFHKTAIFLIPFVFIINMKFNIKKVFLVLLVIIMILLSFENVVYKVSKYIDLTQYLKYLKNSEMGGGGYAYFIFGLITLTAMLIFYKDYKEKNLNTTGQIWLISILTVFSFFGPVNFIFDRLTGYFVPILYVCIPNLVHLIKDNRQRKFFNYLMMMVSILYMYKCLLNNGGQVVPYQTFLR